MKAFHKRTIDTYLRNKGDDENAIFKDLDDIFIELRVHDASEQYKRLEKRVNIDYLELEKSIGLCRSIKTKDLFSPGSETSFSPRKVLVTGKAGIGKTVLAMHLLDLWVKGQFSSAVDLLFFFSLRELSHIGKCSLSQLLFTQQGIKIPSNDALHQILYGKHVNTLVVLDGLDEFCDYPIQCKAFSPTTEVDISQLIGSIICGKTMTSARVLVTSRPGGVKDHTVFDRKTEIYGFVETRILEYVTKFSKGNDKLKKNIENYITDNINIRSFSYVPMLCNLICRIAKMGLERNSEAPLPATITQLLTKCVVNFAIEHHPMFKGKELFDVDVIAQIREPLRHHSKLAKDGMCSQPIKVVFTQTDIERSELSQFATQCGLLTVSREKARGAISSRQLARTYYFVHLIMQEFLAGVALVSNLEETKTLMKHTPNDGQLDMVLLFVSGLVGDPENKEFLQSLGYQTSITVGDFLRIVVKQEGEQRRRNHKTSILLLLMLVFESRQPDLWEEIKDFVLKDGKELNLESTHISPVELQSLVFVMPRHDDMTILE